MRKIHKNLIDPLPIEIGQDIWYKVEVEVPADNNKAIAVIDKMTTGLTYDATSLKAELDEEGGTAVPYTAMTASDTEYDDGDDVAFQIKFSDSTVTNTLAGHKVVITYKATVNTNALVDTGKENEVTLKYDEGHYVQKDKANYKHFFTGIEKVDGAVKTKKLENVKFTLTANGVAFNVTKTSDGWYIPGGSSNEVVTDSNGLIIIRGLDSDKADYVLTETETNAGYNLLKDPKTLTLVEDTTTAYATDNFDQIENNQGAELPHTGGIGTTIFYIGGSVLVLAAAILLITKRRMGNND